MYSLAQLSSVPLYFHVTVDYIATSVYFVNMFIKQVYCSWTLFSELSRILRLFGSKLIEQLDR